MPRFFRLAIALAAMWIAGGLGIAWLELGGAAERRPIAPAVGEPPPATAAPRGPEPQPARVRRPLPPPSGADPLLLVELEDVAPGAVSTGTAFAVGQGLWLTARHVANAGCRQLSLKIEGGRTYPATIRYLHQEADLALLDSAFAGDPLTIAEGEPGQDEFGYSFGYPVGVLGATSDQLIGRSRMRLSGRLQGTAPALAWAEVSRFPDTLETVRGMSGGPMFDAAGRVVGIFAATSSRRGRNYTVAPETIRAAGRELAGTLPAGPRSVPAFDGRSAPPLDRTAAALAKSGRIARVFCDPSAK